MKNFNLLFSDVKHFMANEVNRIFILVLITNILTVLIVHYEVKSIKGYISAQKEHLEKEIIHTRKRVDFRYFNMTRTIQDLYQVKIDTKNGELK